MRTCRWITAAAFFFLAAVVVPERAAAQVINFVAGPSLANISTDDPEFDGSDAKIAFFGGVGTSIPIAENVMVSPYVVYSQKGAEYSDTDEELSYDYIEIPVFLGYTFPLGESLNGGIFAGPQIGFQVKCDETGFDCKDSPSRKSTEFGIIGGVGIQIPVGEKGAFGVSVGGDWGLTDLFDVPGTSFKTQTYWAALSYSLIVGNAPGPM